MKIVFLSNYLNHHQLPCCLEFDKKTAHQFHFIATTPLPEFRRQFGYKDMNYSYDFVIRSYENSKSKDYAMKICIESDVVIIGSAPDEYIIERLKEGKLTYRYTERIYKKGVDRLHLFAHRIRNYFEINRYRNYYVLCASAYTSSDYAKTKSFLGKCYKWGYFPPTQVYENIENIIDEKDHTQILWCGRMIEYKHPDAAVKVAKKLVDNGYDFKMKLIGDGSLRENLICQINDMGLNDVISIVGSMSNDNIRKEMEKSGIFLFTSDFEEGWGAVLNESMNSGCAVVASHAIGSVPFLIQSKKNGYIYKSGDIDDLFLKISTLLDNVELQKQFGRESYKMITEQWCADIAVQRLIDLSKDLINGTNNFSVDEGPCSRADVLINEWFNQ